MIDERVNMMFRLRRSRASTSNVDIEALISKEDSSSFDSQDSNGSLYLDGSDASSRSFNSIHISQSSMSDISNASTRHKKPTRGYSSSRLSLKSVCVAAMVLAVVLQILTMSRTTTLFRPPSVFNLIGSARVETQPKSVPVSEPIFGGMSISRESFEQVRESYSVRQEMDIHSLSLVRLPVNFTGSFHPETLQEFTDLIQFLFQDTMEATYTERNSDYAIVSICIGMDLCGVTPRNHQSYADQHGYDYILASQPVKGVHPKMLKYLVLTWAMKKGYKWVLMMDADALFMNNEVTIQSVLRDSRITNTTNLVATRGGKWKNVHAINNGIFLLRNSEWSIKHCFEIFTARWSYTKFLGRTLIDQPLQLSILIAQGELQWPPQFEEEQGQHVTIVPKRRINAFYRDTEYRRKDDQEGGSWQSGDWIAHFASGRKYSLMIDLLVQEGLTSSIPPVEERFPFQLPAPGSQVGKAGSCWCENDEMHCVPSYHVIGVHKAGTKSLMKQYLGGHPGIMTTGFIEDRVRWLTENVDNRLQAECNAISETNHPAYLNDKQPAVHSCSFQDYSLMYGQELAKHGATCSSTSSVVLPESAKGMPLVDEMVIWENTFDRVRGVEFPQVLHKLQPSGNLIISVRNPVDVLYSAYNHFGDFQGIQTGPEHFDVFIRNMTGLWTEGNCSPSNYRTCLPEEFSIAGSWLSRGMYSQYLPAWLEHFSCPQVHIFDVSMDARTEVERLYSFMGVSDDDVAANVTTLTYNVLNVTSAETEPTLFNETDGRLGNAMNKAFYLPMLNETRAHLEEFYSPYESELCSLIETYPCLNIPLFQRQCQHEEAPTELG